MRASGQQSDLQSDEQTTGRLGIVEILEHLLQGGTAGEVIGLDEKDNEAIYALGHFHYTNGKYAEALKLFNLVVFHDYRNRRGLKALGSCLQVLQRHEEAIKPLGVAMLLEPSDPGPAFQIAECMVFMGQKENAVVVLRKLIEEFGHINDYSTIIGKASGLLELIVSKKTEI